MRQLTRSVMAVKLEPWERLSDFQGRGCGRPLDRIAVTRPDVGDCVGPAIASEGGVRMNCDLPSIVAK